MPHLKKGGVLGMDVHRPWPAEMPSPPGWSSWVLLEEMPCCLRISQHLPKPLLGRGLRALTESPVPLGIVSERDKCHDTLKATE